MDNVASIAESANLDIHDVKILSVQFMTEIEAADDLAADNYLIILNIVHCVLSFSVVKSRCSVLD